MGGARQINRRNILMIGLASSAYFLTLPFFAAQLGAAPAAWKDNATGFAIGGYDPVAYYTNRKPRPGMAGLEHKWGGIVWRFVNTGNRDAFAKHPEPYVPRFAGYDAEALSRGLTVEGSPIFWAIYRGRVVLFRNAASLSAWKANPDGMIKKAEPNWLRLSRDLPGTSPY